MCAHVVSHLESMRHFPGHSGVVECHEDRVDDDTDGDEHVDERVSDEEFDNASEDDPTAAALPAEHQVIAASLQVFLACQRHGSMQLLWRYPAAQTAWNTASRLNVLLTVENILYTKLKSVSLNYFVAE